VPYPKGGGAIRYTAPLPAPTGPPCRIKSLMGRALIPRRGLRAIAIIEATPSDLRPVATAVERIAIDAERFRWQISVTCK
jgi:hypothetical protein